MCEIVDVFLLKHSVRDLRIRRIESNPFFRILSKYMGELCTGFLCNPIEPSPMFMSLDKVMEKLDRLTLLHEEANL